MLKSKYSVIGMVNSVKAEVDSYCEVPTNVLVMAYNTCVQQLYRGVIKEQDSASYIVGGEGKIGAAIANFNFTPTQLLEQDTPEFEDILKVSGKTAEFAKATAKASGVFGNTFSKYDNGFLLTVNDRDEYNEAVTMYYIVRPKIVTPKSVEEDDENNPKIMIMLPNEYVPMVYAYVRGEAYKWVNEDNLAGKWIADYNAQLEGFSTWIESTKTQFGR